MKPTAKVSSQNHRAVAPWNASRNSSQGLEKEDSGGAWGVGAKAVPCQTQTCRMTRTEKANYTLTLTVVLFV